MNNDIFNVDLTRTLPPVLKNDAKMQALSQVIAKELQENARQIKNNVIYARIDELPEKLLDVLAYDLHIDWYDYDYPVRVKRDLIKTSVRVHKKLGTVYAVETALGALHPRSEIEEWFDYGGEPFYFRIVLDVSESRVQADSGKIIRTVNIYKRLTAHLEGLYYQCGVIVEVSARTEYFWFRTSAAGRILAGTEPYRNTRGGTGNALIEIRADTQGNVFESTKTGTEPYRNRIFRKKDTGIEAETETGKYSFKASAAGQIEAGTEPYRNVRGGTGSGRIEVETDTENAKFCSTWTGTEPYRNMIFEKRSEEIEAETETGKYSFKASAAGQIEAGTEPGRNFTVNFENPVIEQTTDTEKYRYSAGVTGKNDSGTEPYRHMAGGRAESFIETAESEESYKFQSEAAGTAPHRTMIGGKESEEMQIAAAVESYSFVSTAAGTEPGTDTKGNPQDSAIEQAAAGEAHAYRTTYCGVKGLSRKNK